MRKILDQKFWSHGTPLGSLGPLSFQAMGPGACQCQILVIWGPCEPPMLVAPQAQAENLKTAGSRCDYNKFNYCSRLRIGAVFLELKHSPTWAARGTTCLRSSKWLVWLRKKSLPIDLGIIGVHADTQKSLGPKKLKSLHHKLKGPRKGHLR